MTSPTADGGRPRRAWIAFLLNLILPPTGYAYVGAWRLAVGAALVLALAAPLGLAWTARHPPGVYAFGPNGIAVGAVAAMLLLAGHAAWLARSAPARHGASRLLLYLVPWALLLVVNVVIGAFAPHPTYTLANAAMRPTLDAGDVVTADAPRANCGRTDLTVGDVVLFRLADDPTNHVARVVAGAGQSVAFREGALLIDGAAVPRRPVGSSADAGGVRVTEFEETLAGGRVHRLIDRGPDGPHDNAAPVTVPKDAWYLLGDNRDDAVDSRTRGPVPAAQVCAVAETIVYAREARRVGRRP